MGVLPAIPSFDPSFGGPVAVVRGLFHGLRQLGVGQTIVTSSTGDPRRDESNAAAFGNADIIWIKPWVRRYYWRPCVKTLIRQKLKECDLVHVHGLFNGISRAVCKVARDLCIPFVLEPFGTLSPHCLKKSSFIKRLSLAFGERKNIESAAGVKFSSEGEFQKFSIHFRTHNGFVVGNGLDWGEYKALPKPGKFRADFDIAEDELLFVFLGRLHPIKGLAIFVPAFLQWSKSRTKRVRLAIVGPDEGGYRKRLEQQVAEHDNAEVVLFAGALYGQDRIQAVRDSDVVVLPSFHENFGITAVEGLACGKPILISDQVDIWPDVKRCDLGEVSSITVESLIASLDKMLLRRSEWDLIGARGHAWAEENCSWGTLSEMILAKYHQIVRQHRKEVDPCL